MEVIGLTGKKGTGKNHIADLCMHLLVQSAGKKPLPKMAVGGFADPLKDACALLFGIDRRLMDTRDGKRQLTTWTWENLSARIQDKHPDKKGFMTVRQVMQVFGTEIMRDSWHRDFWVVTMRRRLHEWKARCDYVFITDVRFDNEGLVIKEFTGKIWLVESNPPWEEPEEDAHASEKGIDPDLIDSKINNGPCAVIQGELPHRLCHLLKVPELPPNFPVTSYPIK